MVTNMAKKLLQLCLSTFVISSFGEIEKCTDGRFSVHGQIPLSG